MPGFYLLIGSVFSVIAAGMAFLIMYQEYRHHFPEGNVPFKKAAEMALATLLFFGFLTFALSFLIKFMI